jgi:AmmeMemoRadiSam system protein A
MTKLTRQDQIALLKIARQAIRSRLENDSPPDISLAELSPRLRKEGACFVTLKKGGELRGCVGTLEASSALAREVQAKAIAAAFHDYRFPPVQPEELSRIKIEVSYLTPPQRLAYKKPEDLPRMLRPGVDGVVLSDGDRKATFLPQVWEQLPEPEQFLSRLCLKMGVPPRTWKKKKLAVSTYQVEKFEEE